MSKKAGYICVCCGSVCLPSIRMSVPLPHSPDAGRYAEGLLRGGVVSFPFLLLRPARRSCLGSLPFCVYVAAVLYQSAIYALGFR